MSEEHRHMVVVDFDGTLRLSSGEISDDDLESLRMLQTSGILTVLATGRSPFSLARLMEDRVLPFDYMILSTGVGITQGLDKPPMISYSLSNHELALAVGALRSLEVDFTVHHPFPENHRFLYHVSDGSGSADLRRRIELYEGFCRPLEDSVGIEAASQLVAIVESPRGPLLVPLISSALGNSFSVVRTTSPLDYESTWIEIFPAEVSKASGISWLAKMLDIRPDEVLAVGNDFNDLDMLRWAGTSYVVEGSPPELAEAFPLVTHRGGGIAEAIRLWMNP